MKLLKLKDNATVKVTTEYGEVNVRGLTSKRGPHPGVVYMPYGIWSNVIVDSQTNGTGMPTYKGIKAEIAPAPAESVLPPKELLKNLFGGGR
jgi:formylmethanofuran dehydrogenase subunit D